MYICTNSSFFPPTNPNFVVHCYNIKKLSIGLQKSDISTGTNHEYNARNCMKLEVVKLGKTTRIVVNML